MANKTSMGAKSSEIVGLRKFAPVCHGPLEGLDYRAERPFINWHKPDLEKFIPQCLDLDPPRLELATLALEELGYRKNKKATLKKGRSCFTAAGLEPIDWLKEARQAAREVLPASKGGRSKGKVYAILRWGYVKDSPYGVYVGQTTKPVEKRYLEHRTKKEGSKKNHGKNLPNKGIEPLYSLFAWANPFPGKKENRHCVEAKLHRALEKVVAKVSGDVQQCGDCDQS